ncbi:MAG: hypothetical protein AAF518_20145 [Spirochaetota bacterium]
MVKYFWQEHKLLVYLKAPVCSLESSQEKLKYGDELLLLTENFTADNPIQTHFFNESIPKKWRQLLVKEAERFK